MATADMGTGTGDWIRHTWGWDTRGFTGSVNGVAFSFRARRMSPGSGFDNLECRVNDPSDPGGSALEGMYRLLLSNRHAGAASEALAALDGDMLPRGCLDMMRRRPELFHRNEIFYCSDWARREGRMAAAAAHPALAFVLPNVVARVYRRDEDPTRYDVRDLLARYAPGALPGSVRSVMRSERPIRTIQVLDALLALPPERHPIDEREDRAFEAVVVASRPVRDMLGDHGHLASAVNGWVAFAGLLARRLPDGLPASVLDGPVDPLVGAAWPGLASACRDVLDAARSFARQALVPLLRASGHADERALLRLSGVGTDIREQDAPVGVAAARALFSGKSLPAILELSAVWHARQRVVDARIRAVGTRFPPPDGSAIPKGTWPVPFPATRAPNGVDIVFLGSQGDLDAEGGDRNPDGTRGLGHCVGSYGPDCSTGLTSIASLRTERAGRLSTVQVSVGRGRIVVSQHRGHGNAQPPRPARAALSWFEAEVASGRIAETEEFKAGSWRTSPASSTVSGRCGYDPLAPGAPEEALAAWEPYLARPSRRPAVLVERAWAEIAKLDLPLPTHCEDARPARRSLYDSKGWDRLCRGILVPLWLADRVLAHAAPTSGQGARDAVGLVLALAFEAALLAGVHALAGGAWVLVLGAQLSVPMVVVSRDAMGLPGAVRRTLGHAMGAFAANRRPPRRDTPQTLGRA